MGIVVRARHTGLGSRVALKFMHPELVAHPEARVRFTGEAQRVACLDSEHVARVLDVGELSSGVPYIVMEYVEGSDLGKILEERGPLPVAQSVDYLMQACLGIAEAHSRGIIHRDIKPANLFVARRHDGSTVVKVLDFGIAKTVRRGPIEHSRLTQANSSMGSPYYASPEQLEDASKADERSDIWALGVTLHELLTNQTPFEGTSQASLIASILTREPIPPRKSRPELPEDLDWIIKRCLEKDPNRRFRRVVELAERLEPHGTSDARISVTRISGIPGQERSNTVVIPGLPPPPVFESAPHQVATGPQRVAQHTVPFPQTAVRPHARAHLMIAAVVVGSLVVTAVIAVVVVMVLRSSSTTEPPPLPPPPPSPTTQVLVPARLPAARHK
jgi:serine/threonine-protein kinase